jgi:uncharacterized iron-regulated protein
MRVLPLLAALALPLAACGGAGAQSTAAPAPARDPILDVASGKPLTRDQLRQRLDGADFVLLGEVHDNPAHHALRAELIEASRRKPALVFEQFPWRADSLLRDIPARPDEAWLAHAGFDAKGWRWPLHAPLLAVAAERDLPAYGSQLGREALRPMREGGAAAAPAPLGDYMRRAPLEGPGLAALDATLLGSHCGQLPPQMVPTLRLSQEARDAAMADALLRAGKDGPAWLLAGDGHVRRDYGVPRFLERLAPGKRVLSVGFVEREPDGSPPDAAARAPYDVVWLTDRAEREDPCKDFGK